MEETILKKNLISYREPHPNDTNFILSTWLRGLYYGNSFYNEIDQDSYFTNYDSIIKKILTKPDVIVKVCCLKEDDQVILGYCVAEKKENYFICHWVFVKSIWRSIGIAKDLLNFFDIDVVTHLTDSYIKNKPKRIKFDPFLI